ncbi:CehA/McbA family metallohydrolase [Paenibacillus sp. CGMCC 1.16610]|uniref:PHP domain-containing protein n=1 Tax=Paenibacillus anseongense TaxID=2682845 RepID=A0ABW9UMR4_9BACL|nr:MULTISPECIES: CehA/McbA family metallohydrolase [Paenibacillus]MBA2941479.1 CehA/McbA family metallohydrolase [Paenibacillus sp. CGMCC 1.16610]MVQ40296.1 PHP domain-containing protein [Paenibacillus anseongense]
MKQWLPFELHCHTFHSDGKQSLLELAEAARELGLRGVALTDHNTMTGLSNRDEVVAATGVEVIPGLEWTTFFGHMLTLGLSEYVDWRNLSPFHIHRGIDGVHRQGGLVGLAHPFRVGSPMCTGCYWEFEVSDWNEIDYMEVWSGLFPSIRRNNARAFAMWTDLLNQGYQIAATSGRDWHVSDPVSEPISATFLRLSDSLVASSGLVAAALDALKRGAVAVSMGPLPQLRVGQSGREGAEIGDSIQIKQGELTEVTVGVDFTAREGHWELPDHPLEMKLVSNKGELAVLKLTRDQFQLTTELDLSGVTWMRAEMNGVFCNVHTLIGFTNAIYLTQDRGGDDK